MAVQDLYEVYPTLNISAKREQKLLLEHDAIVFQHPFYWYSTPAILKEWQDIVLEHGWAYGAAVRARSCSCWRSTTSRSRFRSPSW